MVRWWAESAAFEMRFCAKKLLLSSTKLRQIKNICMIPPENLQGRALSESLSACLRAPVCPSARWWWKISDFLPKMSSMDAHCCLECCLESMSLYAGTQQIRNWIRYWVRCCAIGFAIRFTARFSDMFTATFTASFATMNSPPNS